MPYLNSLASKYSLATQYFANTHPSIGNYFMMTTGQIITNDDAFGGTVSADNLARQFAKDNKTWKVYAESIPSAGYLGGDSYPYLKRHVPFSYFTDVINNPAEAGNIVPFSSFGQDLAAGTLPNFAMIVPNAMDDAHDCPGGGSSCLQTDKLAAADAWLQANISGLITSPAFSSTLLVITFDEGDPNDRTNGGGQVATLVISPAAKPAYRGSGLYQHQNLLSLTGNTLKLSGVPGAGQGANGMSEFFTQH